MTWINIVGNEDIAIQTECPNCTRSIPNEDVSWFSLGKKKCATCDEYSHPMSELEYREKMRR